MTTPVSLHFTLEELVTSQHRDIDNTPNADQLKNLTTLLAPKLEEVRGLLGPMHVNSALRVEALNLAVNGAKNSQHVLGLACDFVPTQMDMKQAYELILNSSIKFDQLIAEYWGNGGGGWIHISTTTPDKPFRRQALMISKSTGGVYLPYRS
jgi:hypothetical protein